MAPPRSRASSSYYARTASISNNLTNTTSNNRQTGSYNTTSNNRQSGTNNTTSYPYETTYQYDTTTTESRPPTRAQSAGRPGTARPTTGYSTLAGIENQEIICAISESRGISPTVGLSFVNLDTGEAVLSQFNDSQTYVKTIHKLMVFGPSNILAIGTSANPKSKLFSIMEEHIEDIGCNITLLDRRYWAESTGLEYIAQLGFREDVESIKTAVTGNYYAVCCFAAALKYAELAMTKTFPFNSLRIKYEPSEGSMMIDLATIKSLELVQNLQNPASKDSLFGLLNETLTPMGARLLRSNILQPVTNPETLQKRYDAVEELSTKEEMFFSTRAALKSFLDTDKILTQLIIEPTQPNLADTQQSINNVIMLKSFIQRVKPVFEALAGSRSEMLREIQRICCPENVETVQALIDNSINEDITYARQPLDLRNQRTYAVKSGVNGLLDVARQTYKESMTDAIQHIADMCEEHSLPFHTKFETSRQFYLGLRAYELEQRDLPAVFINIYRKKDMIECQTLDLIKRNQKIGDAHMEVLLMSDRSIKELILNIREHMSGLFKICECVAMLDMLASFAQVITTQDYSRPVMSETLAIRAGRHPIKEKIQSTKYIPNDVYATQQTRFQIITGCNMSGKSTYIRSVALMSIMAQIGSFVPAQYAAFPIIRQLFARVSMDDNIESNVSTFAAEMREAAFILRNVDRSSMVIVDELGRGTSTRDGLSIATAIAEALVQSRALVWFATHFRDLANILAERNGVVNLHLEVDMSGDNRMEMLYRVASGTIQETHYGIKLAKLLPFPPDVLEHAEHVSLTLEQQTQKRKQKSMKIVNARLRKLMLNLKEHLFQARDGNMDDQNMKEWLKDLQKEFVVRMEALEEEAEKARRGVVDDEEEDKGQSVLENGDVGQDGGSVHEDMNRSPGPVPNATQVAQMVTDERHGAMEEVDVEAEAQTGTSRSHVGSSSRHFTTTTTS